MEVQARIKEVFLGHAIPHVPNWVLIVGGGGAIWFIMSRAKGSSAAPKPSDAAPADPFYSVPPSGGGGGGYIGGPPISVPPIVSPCVAPAGGCPEGTTWDPTACYCKPSTTDDGKIKHKDCPHGSTWNFDAQECQKIVCKDGYTYDDASGHCVKDTPAKPPKKKKKNSGGDDSGNGDDSSDDNGGSPSTHGDPPPRSCPAAQEDIDLGQHGMNGIGWSSPQLRDGNCGYKDGNVYAINEGTSIGHAQNIGAAIQVARAFFNSMG